MQSIAFLDIVIFKDWWNEVVVYTRGDQAIFDPSRFSGISCERRIVYGMTVLML